MKILKVLLFLILATFILLGGTAFYLWQNRIPLLEKAANQAAAELFEGTLRLKDVSINRQGQIVIQGINGKMKTETGSIPLEIEKVETQNSVFNILRTQRSELFFKNFRPIPSTGRPISGTVKMKFGKYSSMRVIAPLEQIVLRDYLWLNPAGFKGVEGTVSGDFQVRIDSRDNAKFTLNLKADETGGEVPARFLQFILPYLPTASKNSKELKALISNEKSAHYSSGIIEAGVVEPGKIKALIQMKFPEQNLNLNLNLTIMVDERHAFFRAFKLLGLFKATLRK